MYATLYYCKGHKLFIVLKNLKTQIKSLVKLRNSPDIHYIFHDSWRIIYNNRTILIVLEL